MSGKKSKKIYVKKSKNEYFDTFSKISNKKSDSMFQKEDMGVTLALLVKASASQADVQRFKPHLGHIWLS